jgi:hypothetical protein
MAIIRCETRFDITATGVLGQYRNDHMLSSRESPGSHNSQWMRARNQQRNWDTMNQIISLRCLPYDIQLPRREGDFWLFEFSIDNLASVCDQPGDLEYLRRDAHGVPMIVGLEETQQIDPMIQTLCPNANTVFSVSHDK